MTRFGLALGFGAIALGFVGADVGTILLGLAVLAVTVAVDREGWW